MKCAASTPCYPQARLDVPAALAPVEAEAIADAFIARVSAEDVAFIAASQRAARPLIERVERFPDRAPRQEQLLTLMRCWVNDLPQEFSLDIETSLTRNSLGIAEYRIAMATLTEDGDSVRQVAIGGVHVRFSKRDAHVRHHVHGLVTRAALVARFAVGDADLAALIRALDVIRARDPATVPEDETVSLAAEGGCWLASAREVSRVDGRTAGRLLHVTGWQVD
jgi:hypothetical protein